MALLLDTHAMLWALRDRRRLGKQALRRLEGEELVLVSAASLYELRYKYQRGKLPEAETLMMVLPETLNRVDAVQLDVTAAIAWEAAGLPWLHRDPFDRLLAATAMVCGADFVTADRAFELPGAPPLTLVW